jgi:hypothetical protein
MESTAVASEHKRRRQSGGRRTAGAGVLQLRGAKGRKRVVRCARYLSHTQKEGVRAWKFSSANLAP